MINDGEVEGEGEDDDDDININNDKTTNMLLDHNTF